MPLNRVRSTRAPAETRFPGLSSNINSRSTSGLQLLNDDTASGFATTSDEDDSPPEFVIEPSVISASSNQLLLQRPM